MMPSTIFRFSRNGCPLRPAFEGSNGSTRAHCSSDRTRSRDAVETLIYQASRPHGLMYGRHALARRPLSMAVARGRTAPGEETPERDHRRNGAGGNDDIEAGGESGTPATCGNNGAAKPPMGRLEERSDTGPTHGDRSDAPHRSPRYK